MVPIPKPASTSKTPKKYSVPELERRFPLLELPAGVSDPRRIRDRYFDGTRLRLRTVEELSGEVLERKLGHKRRPIETDPATVCHTSLYLNEDEFALLAALPGRPLVKVRWVIETDGRRSAVDVFEGELAGLIILEVEFRTDAERAAYRPPSWAGPEVTHREEFSGGALSASSYEDLRALLDRHGFDS
jgi:hypothetical protein